MDASATQPHSSDSRKTTKTTSPTGLKQMVMIKTTEMIGAAI